MDRASVRSRNSTHGKWVGMHMTLYYKRHLSPAPRALQHCLSANKASRRAMAVQAPGISPPCTWTVHGAGLASSSDQPSLSGSCAPTAPGWGGRCESQATCRGPGLGATVPTTMTMALSSSGAENTTEMNMPLESKYWYLENSLVKENQVSTWCGAPALQSLTAAPGERHDH